jgi:hypothetical protein
MPDTMRIKIFIIAALVSVSLIGQNTKDTTKVEKTKSKFAENFIFGGFFGLQFGSATYVGISPMAGYYITPKIVTGIGATYEYYYEKWYSKSISSSIFGGRIYGQYTFIDEIGKSTRYKTNMGFFGQVEYEAINLDRDFSDTQKSSKTNRYWLHGVLVGGGIKQIIGKHSSFNISVMFNILEDKRSPYSNPVARVGLYF